eukprot:CAMPEP_0171769800 /NCGR_PEP_ID=MMETSP0991-20121206/53151_1 /TAXON_ID=483369 /ORGANISM="non described non described, Strain CCMP2098" /LENGTH=84 /DNA_ID=CAMNT_0012374891 /DNA_START=455 /DNA_END=709 /DNA_ORIENTATION=-
MTFSAAAAAAAAAPAAIDVTRKGSSSGGSNRLRGGSGSSFPLGDKTLVRLLGFFQFLGGKPHLCSQLGVPSLVLAVRSFPVAVQ